MQARVDALLGAGAARSVADVHASAQVERVDTGFRLLLTMGVGSAQSSRVIEARSCEELAGAASIAIALLARSTAEGATESPTGESSVTAPANDGHAEAPPAQAPPRETPTGQDDAPAAPASSRLRLLVDIPIGVVGWGSLPSLGVGGGAALGIRWRTLRARAGGELWLPQTHTVSGFDGRFKLQSAHLEGCFIQAAQWLELGPCLGAAIQRLSGAGLASPIFTAASSTAVWFSGTVGLFGSFPTPGFEHLRFFGSANVLVSPKRPRFVIDQLGAIHEPALTAPRLDLGCEWIL